MVKIYLDIDGCIVTYPSREFVDLIKREFNLLNWTPRDIDDVKSRLSKDDYQKIKQIYRASGVKRLLVPIPYVISGFRELCDAIQINILTSRPANRVNVINTKEWLKTLGIKIEDIIFVRSKNEFLPVRLSDKNVIVIDDNLEFLKQYKEFENIKTFHVKHGHYGACESERKNEWRKIFQYIRLLTDKEQERNNGLD
jgi:hypothetical protein